MRLHTVGRKIIAPAGVAVAVGVMWRPLGSGALLLASASFLATQLVASVQSRRQLEAAKRRIAESRADRQRLRHGPDG